MATLDERVPADHLLLLNERHICFDFIRKNKTPASEKDAVCQQTDGPAAETTVRRGLQFDGAACVD